MKKHLAILLSLILLVSVVFAAPVPSATAIPTGNEIADGQWFSSMQKDTPYTDTAGEGAFAIPTDVINNTHTAYTFIKGLQPNTNYTLTFDKVGTDLHQSVSGVVAGTDLTWAEPYYNYIERSVNPMLGTPTLNGSTYTIEFTTTDVTDYSLLFRVINGGTTTLSNFCLTEVAPPTPEEIAGNAIANGTWIAKWSGSPITSGGGKVEIPVEAANKEHSVYTNFTVDANAVYQLSFAYTGTVEGGTWQSGYSGVTSEITNSSWASLGSYIETAFLGKAVPDTANKTCTINFNTGDATTYGLAFRVLSGNGAFTLSNFQLTKVRDLTEADKLGNAIADGVWYDPPQVSGSATLSNDAGDNKIVIPADVGKSNTSVYTKISGLNTATTYTLTMKYSGGTVQSAYSGIVAAPTGKTLPTFTSGWYIDTAVETILGKPVIDTTAATYTIRFTTNETDTNYFLVFRVIDNPGAITLSEFSLVEYIHPEINTAYLLGGDWYHSQTKAVASNGEYLSTPTENLASNSVVVKAGKSGVSYYTKLSELKPYTRYQISFQYNVENCLYMGGSGVVLASADYPTYDGNTNHMPAASNTFYSARVNDTANKKVTYTFTTDDNTEYFFSIRTASVSSAITFSNFFFGEINYTADQLDGNIIANDRWYCSESTTQNLDEHISLVDNQVSMRYSLQYRALFTRLNDLKPYTRYEITFVDSNAVVEPTNSGITVANANRPTYTDGVVKEERISNVSRDDTTRKTTVTFTTGSNTDYFLSVKFGGYTTTSSDIALKNFTFREVPTAEIMSKTLAYNQWSSTGSATITRNKSSNSVAFSSVNNQTIYTVLTGLEPQTTYTLSFSHNGGSAANFGSPTYVVAGAKPAFNASQEPSGYLVKNTTASTDSGISVTFTTNDTENDYTVSFKVGSLSSISLTEFSLTEKPVFAFMGTAVRAATAEKRQGIRFKTKIDKNLLDDGVNLSDMKEIGTVAAVTSQLNGEPLTIEHSAAKIGIAYNPEKDIRVFWNEDAQYVYMTAALVGLKTEDYDKDISVASYLKTADGKVIYGDTETYCVYDVFSAIQEQGSTSDKNVVTEILKDSTVNQAYVAWKNANPIVSDATPYFFSIRTNSCGSLTLSNFTFTENGATANTARILGGDWYHNQTNLIASNGSNLSTPANNISNNSITINSTGVSYYTKLTDLKPSTKYVISFNYSVAAGMQYPGGSGVVVVDGDSPVYEMNANYMPADTNEFISTYVNDTTNLRITYTFTTKEEHIYISDGDITDDASDDASDVVVDAGPIELEVYNSNAPINTNYKGMNATVYHSFGFMNDGYHNTLDRSLVNTEVNRLQQMGYQNARAYFSYIWAYDFANSGGWTFDSNEFNWFVEYAKALEERDMSVMLNQMWYLFMTGKGSSSDGTHQEYLSGLISSDWYGEQTTYSDCIATQFKLSSSSNPHTSGVTNTSVTGVSMKNNSYDTWMGTSTTGFNESTTDYFNRLGVSAVRYGHYLTLLINAARANGINNLDYLLYFTEPSYHYTTPLDPTGPNNQEYLFISRTIRNVLDKNNVVIKHVGPNQGHVYAAGGLLDFVMDRDPDLFDIATAHFYPQISNATNDTYYSYTKTGIGYYQSDMNGSKYPWGTKEFWLDEMYAIQLDTTDCRKTVPATGTQTVIMGICAQQMGVDNALSWMAFNQAWYQNTEDSLEFEDGIHVVGMAPFIGDSQVPYKTYYTTGLFTRFNNSKTGGNAIQTSTGAAGAGNDGLYIGAVELPDGNFTITVASASSSNKKFRIAFDEALGKDLHRYVENTIKRTPDASAKLAQSKQTFENIKTTLVDSIEPWSVHVYTTSTAPCTK